MKKIDRFQDQLQTALAEQLRIEVAMNEHGRGVCLVYQLLRKDTCKVMFQ